MSAIPGSLQVQNQPSQSSNQIHDQDLTINRINGHKKIIQRNAILHKNTDRKFNAEVFSNVQNNKISLALAIRSSLLMKRKDS